MNVDWSEASLEDLDKLYNYIAQRNSAAADRQIERIHAAVKKLERFPQAGRIGRCFGTRELVVSKSPCVVAYRIRHEIIQILRVLHGKRRWPKGF